MGDLPIPKKKQIEACCLNCHFLSKIQTNLDGQITSGPEQWTDYDREIFHRMDRYELLSMLHSQIVKCYKGVWEKGMLHSKPFFETLQQIVYKERLDCFYTVYREGMTYDCAYDIFRIENDNRQLRQSYKNTQRGLMIAAIGVGVTALGVVWGFVRYVISAITN